MKKQFCHKCYNKFTVMNLKKHIDACIPSRCLVCDEIYSHRITHPNKLFCSKECEKLYLNPFKRCLNCKQSYRTRLRYIFTSKYCSKQCMLACGRTETSKDRIKAGLAKFHKNKKHIAKTYEAICCVCNIQFKSKTPRKTCSQSCLKQRAVEAGKKSAYSQKEIRRSKNEILFAELCIEYFGHKDVLTNERIFNGWDADVIIISKKIAILWNGIWHYDAALNKTIKQTQNRDKIKINEIKSVGFVPYIVKDLGKQNELFVHQQFHIFCEAFKISCSEP